jgi:gamma-glutamylputrescine oxidase
VLGLTDNTGADHIDSWYAASCGEPPRHPRLQGDVRADVCVIGGGYTGLSSAIELAKRGYKVAVLEAARIGWGASGRNGGQVINDIASGMDLVEQQLGLDAARKLWATTLEAVHIVSERCAEFAIDCDLSWGYFHAALKPRQLNGLAEMQERAARVYGYDGFTLIGQERVPEMVASPLYVGGLHDSGSGHLHPLKYALGLGRAAHELGVQIYEQSRALKIEQGSPAVVHTADGKVTADFLILGGNAYLGELVPTLDRKIMPVGTYIVATEPLGRDRAATLIPQNLAVCDQNFVLDYYRLSCDHRLLFGGRVSYSGKTPLALKETMRRGMLKVFPQLGDVKVDYGWGGFVDITMNRAPHFGRLAPNIYFAQGFSGHGVALTGLAGRMMAEAIAGQAERFDLYARLQHRDFPGGPLLRTPALVLAMAWYRLRDLL